METITLSMPVTVYCVPAQSFPNGIAEAHERLRDAAPDASDRNYVGISQPGPNGKIVYKAGATELRPGELERQGLEKFIIPAGNYAVINVGNFVRYPQAIKKAFDDILLTQPIHPQGFCLEWYKGTDDVRCMVLLSE